MPRVLLLCAVMGIFLLDSTGCGRQAKHPENVSKAALDHAPEGLTGASGADPGMRPAAPVPYIVIRFDRARPAYEDALYAALARAVERFPAVKFDVVLAMPSLQHARIEEQTALAEAHVEEVVLLMNDMGLPAERIRVAARTDLGAQADEIRIYVR